MNNPFVTGEGDAWYQRNRDALAKYDLATDPVAMLCDPAPSWAHTSKPVPSTLPSFSRIVDIGCSSGERLIAMCDRIEANGVGIDLSHEAIARAKSRTHGDKAPHGRFFDWRIGSFGMVRRLPEILGATLYMSVFVWHWLPREELLSAMDAVTSACHPGDYLCIGDFAPAASDPSYRRRRKYHHLPSDDVWTWKADYPWMFRCTGPWKHVSWRNITCVDHTRNYTLLKRVDWKEAYQEEATPPSPPQSSP